MKRLVLFTLTTAIAVLCVAHDSRAVTADPQASVDVIQPDGSTLTLRPIGDERTGRLITLDGFTVLRDGDGWYRYAVRDNQGRLAPSQHPARSAGLRSADEETFLNGIQQELAPSENRSFPEPNLLTAKRSLPTATMGPDATNNVLILVIQYPDYAGTYPASDFDSLMNQPGFDYYGSVNDYYREISYGEFGVNGTAAGWYTAANPHTYYGYNDGNNWTAAAQLVREAVLAADADVDFSQYDIDSDGYVDGLFVVHAGPGAESGYDQFPWSHAWSLNSAGVGAVAVDGVVVNVYSMEPEKAGSTARVKIGVFCHEYGHVLGIPDLYDTDYSSIGVGDWCLMSGGSWNGPPGYGGMVPAQMCGWVKKELGWLDLINVDADMTGVSLPNVEENAVAYRLWKDGQERREYFLIEYRDRKLFDQYLPGCGVAIWHVDENMSGNSNDYHRLVDLEEMDRSENSSSGDMWLNGIFGPSSNPSSTDYDGSATNVEVNVLSAACETEGVLLDMMIGCFSSADPDQDGKIDCLDNCPNAYNPLQEDWDSDGAGDICDDSDNDGIMDDVDNCREVANPGQEDTDGRLLGDACCCGEISSGVTGNVDCDGVGRINLADITTLTDHVYITGEPLCCPANGNVDGDLQGKVNLADITDLIDFIYLGGSNTAVCP